MDPLVAEYLRKKQGLDQNVSDARQDSEMMAGAAGIGEVVLNAMAPKQVPYFKGWNETGAPTLTAKQASADLSGLKSYGQRQLQAAQENRNQGLQDFDQTQKLTDLSTNRERDATKFEQAGQRFESDMSDAKSTRNTRNQAAKLTADSNNVKSGASRSLQSFAKSEFPNMDPAVIDSMSEAQLQKNLPMLVDKWKLMNKPAPEKDPKTFEREIQLSDRINRSETITNYRKIKDHAEAIEQTLKLDSGQGDIAANVQLNKLLDPPSVVKEGEFARTTMGQALFARWQAMAENVRSGKLYGPELKAEMAALARVLRDNAEKQKDGYLEGQRKTIKDFNLNEERVFKDLYKKPSGPKTPPPSPPPALDYNTASDVDLEAEVKRRGL